jgi:hypothetical protein
MSVLTGKTKKLVVKEALIINVENESRNIESRNESRRNFMIICRQLTPCHDFMNEVHFILI